MISWQITEQNQIQKVNVQENLESVNDVKVKITKCFVTRQDVLTYIKKSDNSPITPCKIAVGQISETVGDSNFFNEGEKVYISPERACYECANCLAGKYDECLNVQFASKNFNGYLKEFAVVSKNNVHVLPPNVNEYSALFIYHIALALTVIDKLKIEKGDHVAIYGSTILTNVIAQLVSYYQSVPILVSANEDFLSTAVNCGVYYALKADKNVEKSIIDITGGRKCSKIIYVTESGISPDFIVKAAANHATVCFTGTTEGLDSTKNKLSLDSILTKQLNLKFVNSGYGNYETAINLIAQKALNLTLFNIPEYKFDYVNKHFDAAAKKLLDGEILVNFNVNLL